MKLETILDQIDLGSIALPEFQRGYVWNRDQVRKLMRSLYRGYPVGGLLMWETKIEGAQTRGDGHKPLGTVKLLLDGQQRITSLYGIVRGHPPQFFMVMQAVLPTCTLISKRKSSNSSVPSKCGITHSGSM